MNQRIYLTKNEWLELFGSSLIRDSIRLFLILPINVFGFLLNILSLFVFCKLKLRKLPLYTYLKFYTFNSITVHLMQIFYTASHSKKYFEFSYASIISPMIACYVYVPLVNLTVFYASLIDILIILDRISLFIKKLKNIFIFSAFKTCIVLYIVCMVINSQYIFEFYPTFMDINLSETETFRIYYFQNTDFALSLVGNILNYTTYACRDVLILLVQVCLNTISLVLIKKHLVNKSVLLNYNGKNMHQQILNMKINFHAKILNFYLADNNIAKMDQNLSIMVVLLTFLSSFEHVFLISEAVIFNYTKSDVAFWIGLIADLSISLKHFFNIFLFYFFNKLFKNEMKNLLRK